MGIPYIQNGNCYVISSFADPNNPLFTDEEEIEDFKNRVSENLGSLCEILGYSFHSDHFQLLVIIKDRESFVSFYNEKYGEELESNRIINSTYIFSQQMANTLSGFAKKFNSKHNRFGALFGRRFTKILIETEEEIKIWIQRMKEAVRFWTFDELWSYVKNFVKRLKSIGRGKGFMREEDLRRLGEGEVLRSMLISLDDFNLRGSYVVMPLPPNLAQKIKL